MFYSKYLNKSTTIDIKRNKQFSRKYKITNYFYEEYNYVVSVHINKTNGMYKGFFLLICSITNVYVRWIPLKKRGRFLCLYISVRYYPELFFLFEDT